MKLHIILAQRACSYDGQYAPEALDIADENTMSDNPEFLAEQLSAHKADSSFSSVGVLVVSIPDAAVDALLDPKPLVVEGTVVMDKSVDAPDQQYSTQEVNDLLREGRLPGTVTPYTWDFEKFWRSKHDAQAERNMAMAEALKRNFWLYLLPHLALYLNQKDGVMTMGVSEDIVQAHFDKWSAQETQ